MAMRIAPILLFYAARAEREAVSPGVGRSAIVHPVVALEVKRRYPRHVAVWTISKWLFQFGGLWRGL